MDDDPLNCPMENLGKIKVLETWIGGQRAHPKFVRKSFSRADPNSEPGLGL
jgi:hypothetical protein